MKKYLLAALSVVVIGATSASAQPAIPNIDVGIKAGANFAQLQGDSWESGYKANFLAGMFVGLRFKKIGVQVEGFFSQSKYTTTGKKFYDVYHTDPDIVFQPIADSAKERRFNVGYINIPVLIQFKVLPMLWIQAGPQYSGVVSIKDADQLVEDSKKLFKKNDFSGVIGLEAKLPARLVIGARYVFGLTGINKTEVSGAWQQRTIQAHIGYNFL